MIPEKRQTQSSNLKENYQKRLFISGCNNRFRSCFTNMVCYQLSLCNRFLIMEITFWCSIYRVCMYSGDIIHA
ncbi:hypothetical protein Pat9b_4807 (plasmid) [Pantoea sp. At-9b]|nr:hypothetical protein Pat9b_4807 [Pantoea sp. At-9b]